MHNPFAALAAEARKLEADAVVLFHKDLAVVAADIRAAVSKTKADVEASVAAATPDIKLAAENAAKLLEQAILATLAAHGL